MVFPELFFIDFSVAAGNLYGKGKRNSRVLQFSELYNWLLTCWYEARVSFKVLQLNFDNNTLFGTDELMSKLGEYLILLSRRN